VQGRVNVETKRSLTGEVDSGFRGNDVHPATLRFFSFPCQREYTATNRGALPLDFDATLGMDEGRRRLFMSTLEKAVRLERLKKPSSGRILTVALEHAPSDGLLKGLEDIRRVVG
jgi:hypothetical protein